MIKFGKICNISAATGMAQVYFTDDEITTDFLPIVFPKASGDSFSWSIDVNDAVACLMDEHFEDGVILGAIYTNVTAPVTPSPDKVRVTFSDGTAVEYDRSAHALTINVQGKVTIQTKGDTDIQTGADTNVTATGKVTIQATGNVGVTTQAQASISCLSAEVTATESVAMTTPELSVTGVISCSGITTAPGAGAGDGSMNIAGKITAGAGVEVIGDVVSSGDVQAGAISLLTHIHTAPAGGGPTSTPE